jgi:hypothetical protein
VRHRAKEPFWQTTAAMIVAVVTLVGSLGGLAAFLVNQKWFSPGPEDYWAPPGASSSPIVLDQDTVLWGPREIRVEENMSVDFDPASGPLRDEGSADLYMWSGAEVSNSSNIYVWSANEQPTLRGCADLLVTHGAHAYIPIKEGMRLCVRTDEGRVASVLIKKRDGHAWLVDATVWRQRLL